MGRGAAALRRGSSLREGSGVLGTRSRCLSASQRRCTEGFGASLSTPHFLFFFAKKKRKRAVEPSKREKDAGAPSWHRANLRPWYGGRVPSECPVAPKVPAGARRTA